MIWHITQREQKEHEKRLPCCFVVPGRIGEIRVLSGSCKELHSDLSIGDNQASVDHPKKSHDDKIEVSYPFGIVQFFILEALLGFVVFGSLDDQHDHGDESQNPDEAAEEHTPPALQEHPSERHHLKLQVTVYTNETQQSYTDVHVGVKDIAHYLAQDRRQHPAVMVGMVRHPERQADDKKKVSQS